MIYSLPSQVNVLSTASIGEVQNQVADEYPTAVILDVYQLIQRGVILQVAEANNTMEAILGPGSIVPARLQLNYPGRLLSNGLGLDQIPEEDQEPVLAVLTHQAEPST